MRTRRFQKISDYSLIMVNKGECTFYDYENNELSIRRTIGRDYFNEIELHEVDYIRINPEEGD